MKIIAVKKKIFLSNVSPFFVILIYEIILITLFPFCITKIILIPISSIRIHKVHRIVVAVGIRADAGVLVCKRVRCCPAGEVRIVGDGR